MDGLRKLKENYVQSFGFCTLDVGTASSGVNLSRREDECVPACSDAFQNACRGDI
jgi:hypothetical protein